MGLLLMLLSACDQRSTPKKDLDPSVYKEPLIEANKHVVNAENEQIDRLLARYNWDMQETGTGLRYMIYEKGDGARVKELDLISLEYTVKLISGDVAYTSDMDGPLEFRVGRGDIISGLDEGVRLLHEGDKARLVIPSYLAYGLTGDQDKIGQKATLIYDIELLKIIKQ